MSTFQGSQLRDRLLSLIGSSFWGLADQAIVSLTSFLTMILLARVLTPDDFGAFVLIYGALLLFNALQSGLFTQPHNVLGSSLTGAEYVRYTTTTLITQLAFSLLLGILAVGAFIAAVELGWTAAPLLIATAPAIIAWQIQEYLRRVYYTEGRVREAFLNDMISYGGQIIGIAGIWLAGALTGPLAIYVLAATSALAALVALWHLQDRLDLGFDRTVVEENWRFGKWLFGANLVQSGRIQLHLMLIGGLVSVTAAGLYRATQNLVAPTHIMMNAIKSIAMPRAAAIHTRDGLPAMRRYLIRICVLGLIPILLYLVAVSLVARPLLHRLYAGQYDGYAWLVWLFSAVYLLAYGGQVLTVVLSAMRITRAVRYGEVVTLVMAISAGVPLIWIFGIGGALVTDIIVGCTLMGALAHQLIHRPQSTDTPAPMVDLTPLEVPAHGD
ncbi:MAG: lipopolysaccharide biosynthesis protein [Thermomicrobiales bacterium]